MRDPKRIPIILAELERVWLENPDYRLGQLVVVATIPRKPCPSIFYIEDEDLLQGIQEKKVNGTIVADQKQKKPYWDLYPDIIRIQVEDISIELVRKFIASAATEEPLTIITARKMMEIAGAPIYDHSWMKKHQTRLIRLGKILAELEQSDELKLVEKGYLKNE